MSDCTECDGSGKTSKTFETKGALLAWLDSLYLMKRPIAPLAPMKREQIARGMVLSQEIGDAFGSEVVGTVVADESAGWLVGIELRGIAAWPWVLDDARAETFEAGLALLETRVPVIVARLRDLDARLRAPFPWIA